MNTDNKLIKRITIPKVQELCTEFLLGGNSIKISVRRHKNHKSIFSIEQNEKEIKEGSMRSVNLPLCLFEIVRSNKYLPYCNLVMAWSTYEFAKARADIRPHPSGDGSWEVRIRYHNGETMTKQYSLNMAQGDVMNSLLQELGLPERININSYK